MNKLIIQGSCKPGSIWECQGIMSSWNLSYYGNIRKNHGFFFFLTYHCDLKENCKIVQKYE